MAKSTKQEKKSVAKTTTKAKATKKEESSSSESSSSESESESSSSESDSSSDSSSSESEEEEEKKVEKKVEKKTEKKEESSSESSDSESESSESESSDSEEEKKEEKKEESSDSDSDSSSSSDSDSSDDEKEEEDTKKRAAEEDTAPAKKFKNEAGESTPAPTSEEPTTVFVGSLSWNIDDEWLKSEFEPLGGVISARVITDRQSGKSRGYGYVDFETKTAADKALSEYQGRELDGRPMNLDISTGKQHSTNNKQNDRAKKFGDTPSEPSDTLFLGNLSFNANRDVLFNTFGEYGSVISVRVPTHPDTEQPKGFGYVQFSSVEEAKTAFDALNGEYIEGRPVRLDYSAPRPDRGGAPSGGRGGFGGRGGRGGRGGARGGFGGRERSFTPTGANRAPTTAAFRGNKKTFD